MPAAAGDGGVTGIAGESGAGGVALGGAGGSASVGPAPIGIVMFFDASVCPSGWESAVDAKGRIIVSTVVSGNVGTKVNSPLADRENRMHEHSFTGNANVNATAVATTAGGNLAPAASGVVVASGASDFAVTGLPFKQLLACRLAQDLGDGDAFPVATVAHFDTASCPVGWSLHSAASGRIVLPAPSNSGVSTGSSFNHSHTVSGQASVSVTSLAASGGAGVLVASSSPAIVNGATNLDTTFGGLPTLQLLVCRKDADSVATTEVPASTLAYVDADTCPSTWERATSMEGYLLVGAPDGALLGAAFGGSPLASGETRMHQHTASGNLTLAAQGVAAAAGCCLTIGASGSASIAGVAQAVAMSPPLLELRYCRKL